ncbi:MAG: 8-amino-3,8-dideoxy-alpha-D-manno-octulosonate transaminase [Paracoccaceae bacterium]|jgi:8-amino-3,8-dideoxy-alpha-D-manno-octulosonate transaminase
MPGYEVIGKEEQQALWDLFEEGGVLFAHGFQARRKRFHVREFETQLAQHFGAAEGLCVSSGTAAIKVALKAMNIQPGDEIITQCFNFIATLEAIVDCGAVPVIAGSDGTLNMDPNQIEGLITAQTKAIMPVHMLGVAAEMDRILAIAAAHDLYVVEDACESVGGFYDGRALGTLGDMGVYSFDFGKTITTGEGGLVLTSNPSLGEKARQYHDHGHKNLPNLPRGLDTAGLSGFNYRMGEMNAVVGKVQLGKLEMIISQTKERYQALDAGIRSNLMKKRLIPAKAEPAYDTFIVEVKNETLRGEIIAALNLLGFGTKNLPDAMNWHCSVYWGHMGFDTTTRAALATEALLLRQIAVPVALGKSVQDYANLGAKLQDMAEKC